MDKTLRLALTGAGAAAVALLAGERRAAAVACNSFNGGNVIYIAGSSASQPVLTALATTLQGRDINVGLVYQAPDSCQGVSDLLNQTGEGTASAIYLDGTVSGTSCDVTNGGTSPALVDLAISDVYPLTCSNNGLAPALTASQMEILGPIQTMTIIVPTTSQQNVISGAAARVVFGGAGAAGVSVTPWLNPGSIWVRAYTSGTLNMIGSAIGLPASSWPNSKVPTDGGTISAQQVGSGTMKTNVAGGDPSTIGILADEAVLQYNNSGNTNLLKVLAFQHAGQSAGYYPDSTPTAYDKINVRQGRYAIWGPLHFVVNVANGLPMGGDQNPANTAKVQALRSVLNYVIATGPNPSATFSTGDAGLPISVSEKQQLVKAEIGDPAVVAQSRAYVVPWCAMQVARSGEVNASASGSGEMSYQPAEPCGCYFEKTATGATQSSYCQACTTNADCGCPYTTCRYGYCEVQ